MTQYHRKILISVKRVAHYPYLFRYTQVMITFTVLVGNLYDMANDFYSDLQIKKSATTIKEQMWAATEKYGELGQRE